MASRDRSQGFGFVYLNVKDLLNKKDWDEEMPTPPPAAPTVNFNKDAPVVKEKNSTTQIRENLDRLQSLHHRIHTMLEELGTLNGKKKGPKDS